MSFRAGFGDELGRAAARGILGLVYAVGVLVLVEGTRQKAIGGQAMPDPLVEPEWHKGCTWCWRTAWHDRCCGDCAERCTGRCTLCHDLRPEPYVAGDPRLVEVDADAKRRWWAMWRAARSAS